MNTILREEKKQRINHIVDTQLSSRTGHPREEAPNLESSQQHVFHRLLFL